MMQFPKGQEVEVVMVAALPWRQRLSPVANCWNGAVCWCADAYEAVARAVELIQAGRTALACVMVDYLTTQEMQVFACLGQARRIRTVAVSAFGQEKKLERAKSLGADEAVMLGEPGAAEQLRRLLARMAADVAGEASAGSGAVPQTPQVLETVTHHRPVPSAEESLADLTARAVASAEKHWDAAQVTTKPAEAGAAAEESGDPLLSKDELDALLGAPASESAHS